MEKNHFWLLVERGSNVVTLLLGLVETIRFVAFCLF